MAAERTVRVATGGTAALVCGLTASAVLVPVAVVGGFRPVVGVPVVIVAVGVLLWLWRPDRAVAADRDMPVWFLPAALAVALLVVLPSVRYANEHVVMDRDPGIYLNAAAWARSRGDLVIERPSGPFAGEPGLIERTTAQPLLAGGDRGFQGLHLLPVQAAALGWIGGDNLMARAPALLAAAGLVLLMAFARRVVGAVWALIAGAALGLTLPFAYLSRDMYSEWPLFALVAGGLWALDAALAERSVRRALVAGAALGAATMARVDGLVVVGGLALALGWWWLRADNEDGERGGLRSSRTRVLVAVAVPIAVGWLAGMADGWLRSRGYMRAHRSEYLAQLALPVAGIAIVVVVAVVRRYAAAVDRVLRRVPFLVQKPSQTVGLRTKNGWRATRAGAAIVVGLFVALAFFAVVVRPAFPSDARLAPSAVTAGLQRVEGEPIDPTRTYAELSGRWLVWYLGAGAVVAAVAGGAVLIDEWARGRRVRAEGLLAAVVAPPLVLFLARPSIYPDQPWASRRFLPTALPGLLIAAAWFGRWLWTRGSPSTSILGIRFGLEPEPRDQNDPASVLGTRVGVEPESGDQNGASPDAGSGLRLATRVGAVVVAVVMVGYPLAVLRPLVRMQQHTDGLGLLREICAEIPGNAAILVVNLPAEAWVPAVLTTFCGRPVAGTAGPSSPTPETVARLAREWRAKGRSLWLVGPAGSVIAPLGARPSVSASRDDDLILRWSLTERPHKTRSGRVVLVAGAVA